MSLWYTIRRTHHPGIFRILIPRYLQEFGLWFTPFPSPDSAGVNLFCQNILDFGERMSNPYVFQPTPAWWPRLIGCTSAKIRIGSRGEGDVIRYPSKVDYHPVACPVSLWACQVTRVWPTICFDVTPLFSLPASPTGAEIICPISGLSSLWVSERWVFLVLSELRLCKEASSYRYYGFAETQV